MKEIRFNSQGPDLSVGLEFFGLIAAAYAIKLSEKNSNKAVFYHTGDNLNPEDDRYFLPERAGDNDGRILRVSTEFYGLDPENYKEYNIVISVYQGNQMLDYQNVRGVITGNTQSSLQFIKLVATGQNPDV
jgi:hypothetical protein